jgi:mediator of RNA polymerase II transcription subunit 13
MWTPTAQTRATAENLLKEILQQFRGLGLLAKLKGVRGSRYGTVPWHVNAAIRGVEGLGRVCGGQ